MKTGRGVVRDRLDSRSAFDPPVAISYHSVGPYVDILRLGEEQEADDETHYGNTNRIPQTGVDVSGSGDDRENDSQAIYLIEHRPRPRRREIVFQPIGAAGSN